MSRQYRCVAEFKAEFGPYTAANAETPMAEASCGLADALAGLDTLVPLTVLPEVHPDAEMADDNLFCADMDLADKGQDANFLRTARRSHLAQRRIVALRRRAMRAQLRRPTARWGKTDDALKAMRDHIYTPDGTELAEAPSTAIRLATHAITLSLVATALPVGAAMMTYNLLKGEDMRATARLTTLTGLALAIIAGNPGIATLLNV